MLTTCAIFNSTYGNWTPSHNLKKERFGHVSWETATGKEVYLMGGAGSTFLTVHTTSEKVMSDGSVEEGFPLEYPIL